MLKTTPSPSLSILGKGEQQGIKFSILKRRYLATSFGNKYKICKLLFNKIMSEILDLYYIT